MKTRTSLLAAALGGVIYAFVAAGCGGSEGVTSIAMPAPPDTCANPEPSASEMIQVELAVARSPRTLAPDAIVTIPVYVHIITSNEGVGDLSDAVIAAQVEGLNIAFAGLQGPGSANTKYRFQHVLTDRTANTAWWQCERDSADDVAMKTALRKGSADDLNLYVRDLAPGLGGYGGFPWWYASNPVMDGPVLDYLGVSTSIDPNQAGDLAAHEVGHWIGLYHTFQGGCDKKNDYVSDTPAHANYTWGCPTGPLDTCTKGAGASGTDPIDNLMNYTADACKWKFTAGQSNRMDQMWATYRQGQ